MSLIILAVIILFVFVLINYLQTKSNVKREYKNNNDKAKFEAVETKLKRFIKYRQFDKEVFLPALEGFLSYVDSSNPRIFLTKEYALYIVNIIVELKIRICANGEFYRKTTFDSTNGFYYKDESLKCLEDFIDEYVRLHVKQYNFNCYFDDNESEYGDYVGRKISENDFYEHFNKDKFLIEMKEIHELVVKYLL